MYTLISYLNSNASLSTGFYDEDESNYYRDKLSYQMANSGLLAARPYYISSAIDKANYHSQEDIIYYGYDSDNVTNFEYIQSDIKEEKYNIIVSLTKIAKTVIESNLNIQDSTNTIEECINNRPYIRNLVYILSNTYFSATRRLPSNSIEELTSIIENEITRVLTKRDVKIDKLQMKKINQEVEQRKELEKENKLECKKIELEHIKEVNKNGTKIRYDLHTKKSKLAFNCIKRACLAVNSKKSSYKFRKTLQLLTIRYNLDKEILDKYFNCNYKEPFLEGDTIKLLFTKNTKLVHLLNKELTIIYVHDYGDVVITLKYGKEEVDISSYMEEFFYLSRIRRVY